MTTFIKITLSNGKQKLINTNQILEVDVFNNSSTQFKLIDGTYYNTSLTLDEFHKLLKHA